MNKNVKLKKLIHALLFLGVFGMIFMMPTETYASTANTLIPRASIEIGGTDDPAEIVPAIQILFLIAIITLAPSLIMLVTGFTRIVIALHFLRSAMGTQQMPPNQVMVGMALILTLFLMAPQLTEINENALQPFGNGEIGAEEAISRGMEPLNRFMRNQVEDDDIILFFDLAGDSPENYESWEDIPNRIIIPAFVLGELSKGFIIGFILYLPFIVIDMVVASVLMAMGMMMLPPAMISMPFKILLFLLSGGWNYVIRFVMESFIMT